MSRNRSKVAPKSAAALMAELMQDPNFRAKKKAQEERQQENIKNYAEMAAPLIRELAAEGVHVGKIGDLKESEAAYRRAMPLLVKWLPKISDRYVKEDIIRTLSMPWAKPFAARVLLSEFKNAGDAESEGLRWALGNALSIVADRSVFEELVLLANEKKYGKSREMLMLALAGSGHENAGKTLVGYLDDAEVAGHAVMALGQLKYPAADMYLQRFLAHSEEWVREEAKKALSRK